MTWLHLQRIAYTNSKDWRHQWRNHLTTVPIIEQGYRAGTTPSDTVETITNRTDARDTLQAARDKRRAAR